MYMRLTCVYVVLPGKIDGSECVRLNSTCVEFLYYVRYVRIVHVYVCVCMCVCVSWLVLCPRCERTALRSTFSYLSLLYPEPNPRLEPLYMQITQRFLYRS